MSINDQLSSLHTDIDFGMNELQANVKGCYNNHTVPTGFYFDRSAERAELLIEELESIKDRTNDILNSLDGYVELKQKADDKIAFEKKRQLIMSAKSKLSPEEFDALLKHTP